MKIDFPFMIMVCCLVACIMLFSMFAYLLSVFLFTWKNIIVSLLLVCAMIITIALILVLIDILRKGV